MRYFVIVTAAMTLASCTAFNTEQEKSIRSAVALQPKALGDSRFKEIMRELDSAGQIVWSGRLNDAALKEASAFPDKLTWMLHRYQIDGGLARSNLAGFTKWYWPWSKTTAVFVPQTELVKLNLLKFNKNEYALANTFVHERNHMFGLLHIQQDRPSNKCDPGYLSGDLAEALVRDTNGDKSSSPHTPVCPALCKALEQRGIWSACKFDDTSN